MKIADIRSTIESLNWSRQNATGGTRDENKRTDLAAILAPRIVAVQNLVIPERFTRDIENRRHALDAANNVIYRWALSRVEQPADDGQWV